MGEKTHPPSVKETAFECPHCGAYTTQYWFTLYARQREDERALPFVPSKEWMKSMEAEYGPMGTKPDSRMFEYCVDLYNRIKTGYVLLEKRDDTYPDYNLKNLYMSKCYHCKKLTIWVHDNIVFPHEKQGIQPNQDLPEDIIKDFEEARDIVGLSPRGAAALLRLCIQKLCIFLGEKGKNINDDIASLVKKGLNPLIQQSLDIVRVIGGQAVHPGVIDLNDDRDTANKLFALINVIADQMITHPKTVNELYGKIPPEKREAIENRDKRMDNN